jgi:hypothetical protein
MAPFLDILILLLTPDGEIRAKELAVTTIYTLIRSSHNRKVVSMLIELLRCLQGLNRTEFNAVITSLALIFKDDDPSS